MKNIKVKNLKHPFILYKIVEIIGNIFLFILFFNLKNREFVTDFFFFKMFSPNGKSLPQKKSLTYSDALFVCSQ